jgi:hypothetical protein
MQKWASGWNSEFFPGQVFASKADLKNELGKFATAEGLAEKFKDAEHPFQACMDFLSGEDYSAEQKKKICGKMKSQI